jgi:hypothetical protein
LRAVIEQTSKLGQVARRRNHQDVANPREHQSRQRVVNQRLVVDRKELLADRSGYRVEAGS